MTWRSKPCTQLEPEAVASQQLPVAAKAISIRTTAEAMDRFNRTCTDHPPELLDDLVDEDCVVESVQPGDRVVGVAATRFQPQQVTVAGDS